MQLLVRCGVPSRTVVLNCPAPEQCDVLGLKLQLANLTGCGPRAVEDMVLVHAGRVLQEDGLPLSACGLQPGSTLHVTHRLLGGGGDGGSTGAESRSCYLEMYLQKKPDKVNPLEELQAKWTRCHLSGETLNPPCVIDELGNLYNKDALLTALLNKTLPDSLAYISGLRSVVELKLNPNPNKKAKAPKAAERGGHQPTNDADFCCSITGLEFNGRFKFLVHRATGHVVSEKAVKEVPAVVQELVGGHAAGTAASSSTGPSLSVTEDFIAVNPPSDQIEELKVKLAAKLAAEREKKAKKKAAKAAAAAGIGAGSSTEAAAGGSGAGGEDGSNGNGAAEAGPGSKAGQAEAGKKRSPSPPFVMPPGAASTAAAAAASHGEAAGAMKPPPAKKVKALEAMPANSNASVFASLFTSSRPAEKETFLCRSTSARGVNLS